MKLFQSPVTVGKSIARWVGGFTSKQLKWEKTQLQQEWSSKTRSLWTVYRNVVGVYLLVEMSLNTPEVTMIVISPHFQDSTLQSYFVQQLPKLQNYNLQALVISISSNFDSILLKS